MRITSVTTQHYPAAAYTKIVGSDHADHDGFELFILVHPDEIKESLREEAFEARRKAAIHLKRAARIEAAIAHLESQK